MTSTPNEGERRKLDAHAMLEARREVFVNRGRRELLMAALLNGTATADDVRDAVKLPDGVDPVCLGSVPGPLARANIISRAGYAPTQRAAGHGRPVTVWLLIDHTAAMNWLRNHPDPYDAEGNPKRMVVWVNGVPHHTEYADRAPWARYKGSPNNV